MQLTTTHLQEISFQICRGNAAFGLLLANEYLAPGHPLRKALACKARNRLTSNTNLPEPLIEAIMGGEVASNLQADWRTIIGPKSVRSEMRAHYPTTASARPPTPRSTERRMAKRERAESQRTTAHLYAARATQATFRTFSSVG